jgi:hypothetical protein
VVLVAPLVIPLVFTATLVPLLFAAPMVASDPFGVVPSDNALTPRGDDEFPPSTESLSTLTLAGALFPVNPVSAAAEFKPLAVPVPFNDTFNGIGADVETPNAVLLFAVVETGNSELPLVDKIPPVVVGAPPVPIVVPATVTSTKPGVTDDPPLPDPTPDPEPPADPEPLVRPSPPTMPGLLPKSRPARPSLQAPSPNKAMIATPVLSEVDLRCAFANMYCSLFDCPRHAFNTAEGMGCVRICDFCEIGFLRVTASRTKRSVRRTALFRCAHKSRQKRTPFDQNPP